jgi:hypothetical protein
MFAFLTPLLFMSGCYQGSVTRRLDPDRRQNHEARSNMSQTSGIPKFLASGQWYVAFLALRSTCPKKTNFILGQTHFIKSQLGDPDNNGFEYNSIIK